MKTTTTNPFDPIVKEYDQWFDDYRNTFLSELEAIKYFVPTNGTGVDIGVGTARFAKALGIRYGIEPSEPMADYARKNGIDVITCGAEELPYNHESFDFAIMVAVDPFVQDIEKTYREIYRILKKGGKLIVGTLHKDGAVAKKYMNMTDSEVYKNAQFHAIPETVAQLQAAGFTGFNTCQSLFTIHPDQTEKPLPGYDKGSFVALEAIKTN